MSVGGTPCVRVDGNGVQIVTGDLTVGNTSVLQIQANTISLEAQVQSLLLRVATLENANI